MGSPLSTKRPDSATKVRNPNRCSTWSTAHRHQDGRAALGTGGVRPGTRVECRLRAVATMTTDVGTASSLATAPSSGSQHRRDSTMRNRISGVAESVGASLPRSTRSSMLPSSAQVARDLDDRYDDVPRAPHLARCHHSARTSSASHAVSPRTGTREIVFGLPTATPPGRGVRWSPDAPLSLERPRERQVATLVVAEVRAVQPALAEVADRTELDRQ